MVKAWLEFDPRYDTESLNKERKELERKQRSKIYDVTAWSPALAYDVDALWCDAVEVDRTRLERAPVREGSVVPPPAGATGLYHAAIRYPDRAALARALRRLVDAHYPLDGASDHGVSEALYLRDPDGATLTKSVAGTAE